MKQRGQGLACAALFALTGLLTPSFAYSDTASESKHASHCEERLRETAIELERLGAAAGVPAMGLSVFCHGQPILTTGFGTADADTPFRWGSITKSVTGLAALLMTRQSDLSLDLPIRPIIGEGAYQNPWSATDPVRLRHLLALSSGLPDLSRIEWNDNEPRSLWQALRRNESNRQLLWPSGLQHSYSNVPPGLTAAVVERVSGQTFEQVLRASLFEPLGMQTASLAPLPGLPGGFKEDGETEIPYWHMTFTAFGALNASTREMSRMLTALLNDGQLSGRQVLPADLVDVFFQPTGTLADQAGLEVGYGAGVYGWVRNGQLFHGHGGDADGYRSRYGLLREAGHGYLVVINTDDPRLLGRMRRMLEDALSEDLPRQPLAAQASTQPEQLDALVGDYYPASIRFDRGDWRTGGRQSTRISRAGQTLILERNSRPITLFPAGGGRFFREGDPAITAVFVRDRSGSLHLQGELGNFVRISPGPCPDFLPFCD